MDYTPEGQYGLVPVYLVYFAVSIGLTVWLARTLFRNGAILLEEVFADSPRMAVAVNHLLVVGFYLFNLGYALFALQTEHNVYTATAGVETLARKLGSLLLVLGVMHMTNLFVFHRIRRRTIVRLAPPPVRPQMLHNSTPHVAASP